MNHTRIDVLINGVWKQLRLRESGTIRYNAVINRIGNIATREISHSNTFSLPSVFQNTDTLGLNVFNKKDLAKALNKKFEAKYYIQDRLIQEGFLLINNTNGGTIQVNFIDKGLDLVSKWGDQTFNELLLVKGDSKPLDIKDAITLLEDNILSIGVQNTHTTDIGTRGYRLALFPNNLNCIGDKFQVPADGVREADKFNVFQSRPIYNAKAIMDIACESFGFTTIFDSSINLTKLQKLWIVDDNLNQNQESDSVLETKTITDSFSDFYFSLESAGPAFELKAVFEYGNGTEAIKPNTVFNFAKPTEWSAGFENQKCIYQPNTLQDFIGTVKITGDVAVSAGITSGTHEIFIRTIWEATVDGDPTISVNIVPVTDISVFPDLNITFNKSQFDTTPAGTNGTLIGILIQVKTTGSGLPKILNWSNMKVVETLTPKGVIRYDEFGQYVDLASPLTHAAPHVETKKLMASIMQQQGILMNINGIAKTVKFFTYGHYATQVTAGNIRDWSKFYRRHNQPLFNTDYGSNYAKLNKISLTDPFPGNTFNLLLKNQGEDSKYKTSGDSIVQGLKDISDVIEVNIGAIEYFEHTNEGIGMVEEVSPILGLTEIRADKQPQGTITSLPALVNVNYGEIPDGVTEWFKLVDEAVQASAKFLLPLSEVKDLDLSQPVYINDLGGYWIVEEIQQYVNAQTPVTVKLIKLIDGL
ncbi:MAG: hypothetical protein QQN55_03660 [Nitrosopumilus sp.]